MARRPSPWYWEARGCWYVQFCKKQHRLDPNKDKAWKMYGRMLAAGGGLNHDEIESLTLAQAVDLFCDKQADNERKEATRQKYVWSLSRFAEAYQHIKLDKFTKANAVAYCRANPSWSEGYRHSMYSDIKSCFKWCRNKGYLSVDPMAIGRNPFGRSHREDFMTLAQFDAWIAVPKHHQFQLLIKVLYFTGCRPGEASKLNTEHLHPIAPVATLEVSEHKTGNRTGRERKIVFPEALMVEVRAVALGREHGAPILVNSCGGRWRTRAITSMFRYYANKAGLPKSIVPYCARHGFATCGIESGENTAMLAKAMGHSGDRTIQAHYLHASNTAISEIVERRAKPAKKSTAQEMRDEMRTLSARLAELTTKILDGDNGAGTTCST